MANAPRSSFIPKQISGATPKTVQRKRVFSITNFVAGLLLVASVLAAGGAFLYKTYLERSVAGQQEALTAEYQKFDEADIAEVKAFDKQLQLAEHLLEMHASPSVIFDALEANTKESVQYTSFSYERRPSGGVTLSINGVTNAFDRVALQWTAYLQDTLLGSAIMTRLARGVDEEASANELPDDVPSVEPPVHFALLANFDASRIPYTVREDFFQSGGPDDASQEDAENDATGVQAGTFGEDAVTTDTDTEAGTSTAPATGTFNTTGSSL